MNIYRLQHTDQPSFRILWAFASKHSELEFNKIPTVDTLHRIKPPFGIDVDILMIADNTTGLPTVYNKILDDYRQQYDVVVLCHDDVSINDCLVYDKIMMNSNNYAIIGTAGGRAWIPPTDTSIPHIWTKASNGQASGFVMHHPNDMVYIPSTYGINGQTLTLDGNFLCFTKQALDTPTLRFDEQFPFHYYDIDITFQAYQLGLHCGTVGIMITHSSLGQSVRDADFLKCQQKFLNKYNLMNNNQK